MAKIKGVLLDLSGTLYSGSDRIEGTRRCLAELERRAIPYRFLTNTTTQSRARIVQKLASLGVVTKEEWILTPMAAACERFRADGFASAALFVAEEAKEDFSEIPEDRAHPDVVILGDLGREFDYDTLNQAFRLIADGAAFYALARNRCFESGGELFLDMGPFVEALAYASRKEPVCLGKPSKAFFENAVAELDVPAESVAVVGDDLESDVLGAMHNKLIGILVQTGKFNRDQLDQMEQKPDAVIESIAVLPELLSSS
ncbi:TIGR01458 family HAD-type hydrolase [Coraliomargarita sinensis]|nr:TIGR01458 family HAD-type hydrolase [Coraliomargarita sinensis]